MQGFSLASLLKIARRVGLIEYFELTDQRVLLLVEGRLYVGNHQEVRAFVSELLSTWWQQQEKGEGTDLGNWERKLNRYAAEVMREARPYGRASRSG